MKNRVEDFLDKASRAYYAGNPIISDAQFDALADSVGYNKIGAKQHQNVEKHLYKLYSLQKYYEETDAFPFEGYKKEVSITPKIDGAAVSLLYVDHVLVRALTRGDGVEGTIVTEKFTNTKLVPKTIPKSFPSILQVVGELAAPSHIENARNYAAGALNLGSLEEFKSRAVTFFAYGVFPFLTKSFTEDISILGKIGFNTVLEDNIVELYPTDGSVFRLDDNSDYLNAGFTSKHPKGAFAKKDKQETVDAVLLGVDWQVGKSGRVTPVAILSPIKIEDKTITRATLNNPGFIEALDLRIGDTVAVRLAGMIIPEIVHKVEA